MLGKVWFIWWFWPLEKCIQQEKFEREYFLHAALLKQYGNLSFLGVKVDKQKITLKKYNIVGEINPSLGGNIARVKFQYFIFQNDRL